MILAVDVGNTNIVFGGFDNNGELSFISRLNTQVSRMEDQYAIKLKDILSLYGFENAAVTGCIISSVVSPITPILEKGIEKQEYVIIDSHGIKIAPSLQQ